MDVAAIYESSRPQLRRIAERMGLAPADAEDALQDAYVALLQHRPGVEGPDGARRWLVRVTVNRCLLYHRRRARRSVTSITGNRSAAIDRSHEGTAPSDEVRDAVRAELERADEQDRIMLILRYYCEFDATVIGEMLAMPSGTVRSRLHDARLRLAEGLIRRGMVDDVE